MIRFALLPLLAVSAHAETIAGRVVAIADGDTLTVLDASNQQHKIRLAGIDAPEKKQPFGDRSKQHLAQMVGLWRDPAPVEPWVWRKKAKD